MVVTRCDLAFALLCVIVILFPRWWGIPHQDPEHVHLSSLGAPGTDIRVLLGYSEGREVVTSVSAPGHVVVHTI